jgi:hypothetical protein
LDVTVAVEAPRPFLGLIFPNGCMNKQRHGQMVFDEVLSGASEIQWVPVLKRISHDLQLVLRHITNFVLLVLENIVPGIVSHVAGFDP